MQLTLDKARQPITTIIVILAVILARPLLVVLEVRLVCALGPLVPATSLASSPALLLMLMLLLRRLRFGTDTPLCSPRSFAHAPPATAAPTTRPRGGVSRRFELHRPLLQRDRRRVEERTSEELIEGEAFESVRLLGGGAAALSLGRGGLDLPDEGRIKDGRDRPTRLFGGADGGVG